MVDVSSIVVAILSLVGTLIIGVAGIIYTWNSDERKRRSETEKLVAKYRDPLMVAAHDLRSRLHGLSDLHLAEHHRGEPDERDNLRMYTAFVVGQYLSWTYILRRQAQFLMFSTNKKNNDLTRILAQITDCFAYDTAKTDPDSVPFKLWRAEQLGIGELMTVHDGTELYCMGYAAFRKAYHANVVGEKRSPDNSNSVTEPVQQDSIPLSAIDVNVDLEDPIPDFKSWFKSIIEGTETIARARCAYTDADGDPHQALLRVPDHKIRKLQHLLFDLVQTLDPALVAGDAHYKGGNPANDRCHRAETCSCSTCRDNNICPSPNNYKVACPFTHRDPLPDGRKRPKKEKFSEHETVSV